MPCEMSFLTKQTSKKVLKVYFYHNGSPYMYVCVYKFFQQYMRKDERKEKGKIIKNKIERNKRSKK